MDVLSLKRHLPSIEEGRWVDASELPALRDIRVKVRGASSRAARALFSAKERAIDPRDRDAQGRIKPERFATLLLEMLAEYQLVDIEGLTADGKALSVEDVRALVVDPAFQPVSDLIMQAVSIVDETREAQVEALAGN